MSYWKFWLSVLVAAAAILTGCEQAELPPDSLASPAPTSLAEPIKAHSTPIPGEIIDIVPVDVSVCETLPQGSYVAGHTEHFLEWSPGGRRLLFREGATIRALDSHGNQLIAIVDANPGVHPAASRKEIQPAARYNHYASLSPDGSRLAYSTCEFEVPVLGEKVFAYRIATIEIGTMTSVLLSGRTFFPHHPVWSPEGDAIALTASTLQNHEADFPRGLFTIAPDGTNLVKVVGGGRHGGLQVDLHPPVWSRDGNWLAFLGIDLDQHHEQRGIYVIHRDGSGIKRIGQDVIPRQTPRAKTGEVPPPAATPPSWSLDGTALAFATFVGQYEYTSFTEPPTIAAREVALHVASPDGSNLRTIWRSEAGTTESPITQVEWSPDGSALLVASNAIRVMQPDGTGIRTLHRTWGQDALLAAWSPDGSRVAIYNPTCDSHSGSSQYFETCILTLDQDGADVRVLARAGDDGTLHAWNAPVSLVPADPAACSAGLVVEAPETNPGLVGDCERLLRSRETLAGGAGLNWSADTPLAAWDGIELGSDPVRVIAMALPDRGLSGRLPPELGGLTELRTLDLSTSLAPPNGNRLMGTIPEEWRQLTQLERLDLGGNALSGPIPNELGDLSHLRLLNLENNFLRGAIPEGLGDLSALTELHLGENQLTGRIPATLGGLVSLQTLRLARNQLSEDIPPDLGKMVSLRQLNVRGNSFSGCLPPQLASIWFERLQLDQCNSEKEDGS